MIERGKLYLEPGSRAGVAASKGDEQQRLELLLTGGLDSTVNELDRAIAVDGPNGGGESRDVDECLRFEPLDQRLRRVKVWISDLRRLMVRQVVQL